MTDSTTTISTQDIGKHFSDTWYDESLDVFADGIYEYMMSELNGLTYPGLPPKPGGNYRSLAACNHVIKHVPKGGRVLDMACGIGFISHCLTTKGYDAEGFDIAEKAIERAKSKSELLGQDPEKFVVADQRILETMEDNSFDAILAMGYFRYLSKVEQDYCYKQVARILKPGGKFVIVHQNILFEMFAMNDGTLKFWADTINEYSDVEELLDGQSVIDTLKKTIDMPCREFNNKLTSRKLLNPEPENPLTFPDVAKSYGFKVDHISCPNAQLLPPLIEATVDPDKLTILKHSVCRERADDWRSMFMDYEFVAFLTLE